MNDKGIRRTFWMPKQLDEKAEEIRCKLALGRSGFYRFAIIEVIKQFAVSQEKAPKQEAKRNG